MTDAGMRDLYERRRRALLRRPGFGRTSGQARGRVRDALTCDVEEGSWRARVDESQDEGGAGGAPHAETVMRASIVASLAMGYRVWGARLGVAIEGADVDLVCESDSRGQLGIDGVPVGWQRIIVGVRIASRAPEAEVRRVVATADRLNPMLANLSPAIARVHHLQIVEPDEA